MQLLLSRIVGAGLYPRPYVELTNIGIEVQKSIEHINRHEKEITILNYVIMPNHVHMVIHIKAGGHGSPPL